MAGSSSRSGTASARWSSAMATRFSSTAAIRARSTATIRSCSRRSPRSFPTAACSTARSSSSRRTASISTRCRCASTRPNRACACSPARRRQRSSSSTSFAGGERSPPPAASPSAARRSKRCSGAPGRRFTSPRPPATAGWPATGSTASRAPASTASSPSSETLAYQPGKRVMVKVKHERECDCVVAGFRWHKRGAGEAVGSLLLGLYDAAGALQHVGVCSQLHRRPPARTGRPPGALPHGGPRRPSVAGLGGSGGRRPGAAACPGPEPVEPGQGPVVGAAPPRAGGRGRLRPHAGPALPPHRPVPPLAARQAASRLRLRPARGRRRRRSSWRSSAAADSGWPGWRACSRHAPASRRLVRVRRLLRRARPPARLQVHADARPVRRAAAHASTSTSSAARCFAAGGWRSFQRSRPASAASRSGELATVTSGILHPACWPLPRLLGARRLHARRLAVRLAVLRRPRRIAEAGRLVALRQCEKPVQRAGRGIDAGMGIAALRQPVGNGRHGEGRRDRSRAPRPSRAASRRARRAAAAPNRRSRWCGPWRSGCSRGRRRGVPPSTISTWRRRACAARSRATAPAPRGAPR